MNKKLEKMRGNLKASCNYGTLTEDNKMLFDNNLNKFEHEVRVDQTLKVTSIAISAALVGVAAISIKARYDNKVREQALQLNNTSKEEA